MPAMRVEIRPFSSTDDLHALTHLVHRAYAPHLASGLRYWGTHQSVDDTRERLESGAAFIMTADGGYAGIITVRPPMPDSQVPLYRDPTVYSVAQFCVAPEHQGKGLGRRLHDYAVEVARQRGAQTIALDTAKPAVALIARYVRWGYAIVGECDWRPHTNYVSVVMARPAHPTLFPRRE